MRQTRNYLLAGLALVAAVSCNKVETPVAEGTPLTIKATIGTDADTKVSYTPDGNVIKTAWESSETISVITVNSDGEVQTIDNFTYTGAGGKTVAFTGTLSAGATSNIFLLYPALEDTPYDSGKYGSPQAYDYSAAPRAIQGVTIGKSYATFSCSTFSQKANNNTDHLKLACILEGTGTVSGGVLETTMHYISSVIKLDVTLPADAVGKNVRSLQLVAYDSSDIPYEFYKDNSWLYYFEGDPLIADESQLNFSLGSWSGGTQTELTLPGTSFTAYIPITPGEGAVLGPGGASKIEVRFYTNQPGGFKESRMCVPPTNVTIEPGKVYRASVDFSTP